MRLISRTVASGAGSVMILARPAAAVYVTLLVAASVSVAGVSAFTDINATLGRDASIALPPPPPPPAPPLHLVLERQQPELLMTAATGGRSRTAGADGGGGGDDGGAAVGRRAAATSGETAAASSSSGGGAVSSGGGVASSYVLVHPGVNGPPLEYAMPLYGYAMPPLMILTIVANTFVAVVLSQRHMVTPTNIVLLAMAVCDMLALTFPAPWFFYLYTMGNHHVALGPSPLCVAYQTMCEVLPNAFRTTSIWLTVLLAVQRYIYICQPTAARTLCTVPNVSKTIALITALAFGHMIPKFFDETFYDVVLQLNGKSTTVCARKMARWLVLFTPDVFYNVYYSFKMVFVNLIPCIVLVVLNILLFRALRRAKENKKKLQDKNKQASKRSRDSQSTTLMLIVVVTVFLATEIPLTTVLFVHALHNNAVLHVDYAVLNAVLTFVNFSLMMSYPFNFAIYCGMSKQFRNTFRELFITGWLLGPGEPNKAQLATANPLETTI